MTAMLFDDVVRTTGTCRYFTADPVPRDVLFDAVELARFAPQGGNRQGVRLVIVTDPVRKHQLAALYQQAMAPFRAAAEGGVRSVGDASGVPGTTKNITHRITDAAVRGAYHLTDHFAESPAIIVVYVDMSVLHATDTGLHRLSIVGGGSVYPFVQNLLLALRSRGVGSAITTLLCEYEPQVKQLLNIPDSYATAAHIAIGYPRRGGFPARLSRLPVEELAFVESFGTPLSRP